MTMHLQDPSNKCKNQEQAPSPPVLSFFESSMVLLTDDSCSCNNMYCLAPCCSRNPLTCFAREEVIASSLIRSSLRNLLTQVLCAGGAGCRGEDPEGFVFLYLDPEKQLTVEHSTCTASQGVGCLDSAPKRSGIRCTREVKEEVTPVHSPSCCWYVETFQQMPS
jgi:hypothetical protein